MDEKIESKNDPQEWWIAICTTCGWKSQRSMDYSFARSDGQIHEQFFNNGPGPRTGPDHFTIVKRASNFDL